MRILIANDGLGDAGGVQAYLDAVAPVLQSRGHQLAVAYCDDLGRDNSGGVFYALPRFCVAGSGRDAAFARIREWHPDICYSHNMSDVGVDRTLAEIAPVVKFMHGYFGTCIGGLKTHAFPVPVACSRVYGPACTLLYFPRKCGQLNPVAFFGQWSTARAYRRIRSAYAGIVVASEHMRAEFERSGCDPARLHANPLFPTEPAHGGVRPAPGEPHVVFLGRMTPLKGGDLLIRAVDHAQRALGRSIRLTMVGDGPARRDWEAVAAAAGVACEFTGWKHGEERWPLLQGASVLAVPSVWPEPFGLVGLEAGAVGVPAVAVNVGGISEWLHDGVNGVAVTAPATAESFGAALASTLGDRSRLNAFSEGAYRVAREMTIDRHVDRLEAIFAAS